MGADSDSEYDPEEEREALAIPPPPPGPPPAAPDAEPEMYDPFAGDASGDEDDAGYYFDEDEAEDEEQAALREQAALAMKQRDLKLSLEAKEVFPRSTIIFSRVSGVRFIG
jgi:hypothetical protein